MVDVTCELDLGFGLLGVGHFGGEQADFARGGLEGVEGGWAQIFSGKHRGDRRYGCASSTHSHSFSRQECGLGSVAVGAAAAVWERVQGLLVVVVSKPGAEQTTDETDYSYSLRLFGWLIVSYLNLNIYLSIHPSQQVL